METSARYRLQVILGYSMSLLLVVVTAIVEFTADECAPFRPRFGQGKCFFGGENEHADRESGCCQTKSTTALLNTSKEPSSVARACSLYFDSFDCFCSKGCISNSLMGLS
jgi:hypothetical protein